MTRGGTNGKEVQEDGLIGYGAHQTAEWQFTGDRLGGRIVNMKKNINVKGLVEKYKDFCKHMKIMSKKKNWSFWIGYI